jgi:alpha-1,6-mannosyltransferase
VAAVTGGVWLAVAGRERLAGAALAAAVGLKVSAGVMLPFLVAGARGRRREPLAGALAAGAAALVVTFAVFGTGIGGMLRAQVDQQNLVATASVPNQLGRLLGLGGVTGGIRAVALVLLAAALATLLVRTWRGRLDWIAAGGWATLATLVASAWLMPWYVTWVLPLAALGRDRRLVAGALALCAYLVVMRTPI